MLLKDKRIFIVEDNVANRAIAQLVLEQNGAAIAFERWGGTQTIDRLRAFMPVDVILLDLMFPNNVTGYQVFENIRAHHEFDHIPIIAVSASNPTESIPRTKELGFCGFISKPIDMDLFPRQIVQVLETGTLWEN